MFGRIKNKFEYVQLALLGLVAGSGLAAAAAAMLANNLDTTPIVAGMQINHNETLVDDEGPAR